MSSKIKNFESEISVIREIENFRSQPVKFNAAEGEGYITKVKKDFYLEFDGLFKYPDNGKLEVYLNGILVEMTSSDFDDSYQTPMRGIPCKHTFDIDGLSKGKLNDKSLFKMFFFDTSKRSNLFWKKLESPKHDGIRSWSFDCVRIDINNVLYDISQYEKDDQKFIVIENLDAVSFIDFQKDSYAIQKGVGFLCGYMPGGEHYIFSGENFEYSRLARESLKSIYYPVTSNAHSFVILHDREIAERYDKILKEIPGSVISTFISQIRNSEELSVALIFLMEVLHLKSVVSMPGVFSVILESFANIIINPLQITSKLITNKNLAKEVIDDMNSVLDRHASKLNADALIKLRRRLTGLNNPINPERITNAEKLREPFDQLGIILSSADEEAINYRNYLLHGNILMNDEEERTSKEIDDHMLYISAKLYTLISKLILKKCGFSGHVINHAKFYSYSNAVNDPDYFELI